MDAGNATVADETAASGAVADEAIAGTRRPQAER